MTKHHLSIAVATLIAVVLLAHLAFPRYEWRASAQYNDALIRIDRWTGRAEIGAFRADLGQWVSQAEMTRERETAARQWAREAAEKTTTTHADINLPYESAPPSIWDEVDQAFAPATLDDILNQIDATIGPEPQPGSFAADLLEAEKTAIKKKQR